MRLQDHPRISRHWPPPVCDALGNPKPESADCQDTIEDVNWRPMLPHTPPRIIFTTTHAGRHVRRDLPVQSEGLARRLWTFLKDQRGKTIQEVGSLEVDSRLPAR